MPENANEDLKKSFFEKLRKFKLLKIRSLQRGANRSNVVPEILLHGTPSNGNVRLQEDNQGDEERSLDDEESEDDDGNDVIQIYKQHASQIEKSVDEYSDSKSDFKYSFKSVIQSAI